jgi:hypothetical protein
MYCRFSLECFGNHIYAASRAKTIGVSSTSELPISSWGKICLSLYAFVLIFHVAFLLHAYSKYSILSMFLELFIHLLILQSSIPKKND